MSAKFIHKEEVREGLATPRVIFYKLILFNFKKKQEGFKK
jgi:hypothetical protein